MVDAIAIAGHVRTLAHGDAAAKSQAALALWRLMAPAADGERPRGRARDAITAAGATFLLVELLQSGGAAGARECAAGALANLALVRLPLLALLAYYTQYLVLDGSPLIVDFGFDDVPKVVPPGVVWTIFGLLLLPIL